MSDMLFIAYHAAIFFHAPKKAHGIYKRVHHQLNSSVSGSQTSEDHLAIFKAAFPPEKSTPKTD